MQIKRLRLALHADPEALALGHVVFLHGALDGFLGVPADDRKREALSLTL